MIVVSRVIIWHARFLVYLFLYLLAMPALAATSDEFSVRVLVGDDTIPPSVPVMVSATATAATQIDIDWLPATDNYLLSGYILRRDGVVIATTTQTEFVDTGLTPETLYAYTVQAFDSFNNFSASSSPLATTTLALPPPPATTTASEPQTNREGTAVTPVLASSSLMVTETEATLRFWLTTPARLYIRWGHTQDYEKGYLLTDAFVREHSTSFTDLEPGTRYYFEIIAETPRGLETVLMTESFTTVGVETEESVPNVRQFTAVTDGGEGISRRGSARDDRKAILFDVCWRC
jgi:chitodextrinase